MNRDLFRRAQDVFQRAIALEGGEREEWVASACAGDAELAKQVQALLAHDAEAGAIGKDALAPRLPLEDLLEGRARTTVDAWDIPGFAEVELLSSGGMGTVLRARQLEPSRTVAIKLLRAAWSEKATARFLREAQIATRVVHPNIARIYATGAIDTAFGEQPYFVMEFLDGESLLDSLRGVPRAECLQVFAQICDAVDCAHRLGVLHRDLKPDNIWIVRDDAGRRVPKILDFGIAIESLDGQAIVTRLTDVGEMYGTLPYMSPEQLGTDPAVVDARTDVYALGVVLFEMLTGTRPHDLQGASTTEAIRRIRDHPPGRLGVVDTSLRSSSLEAIVSTAMHRNRTQRYGTAASLADDVRRHLAHERILARPLGLTHDLARLARRHRRIVVTLASILLISVSAFVWSAFEARTTERRLRAFDVLAWISKYEDGLEAARALLPRVPGEVAPLSRWADQHGAPLLRSLPEIRGAIARRRALAKPSTVADAGESFPGVDRLSRLRPELAKREEDYTRLRGPEDAVLLRAQAQQRAELAELRDRIASLEERVADRRSIGFASDVEAYVYDALVHLEMDLVDAQAGRGLVAATLADATWTSRVVEASVDTQRRAWTEAAAAIARDPRYRGLQLAPQVGLVPIGTDPGSGLWEFAHLRSGRVPARDAGTGQLSFDGDAGIVFVLLPGGAVTVGAQSSDAAAPHFDAIAAELEQSVHAVELDAFFLSKYELTKGQWQRLSGGPEPCYWRNGEHDCSTRVTWAHPVEWLSWDDAMAVFDRHGLEMPTEAQWEYGARGGADTPWWTGAAKESLAGAANIADLSALECGMKWHAQKAWPKFRDGHGLHAPVDALRANLYGLHHVHGNVAEWCRDLYSKDVAPRAGDGQRIVEGKVRRRAVRGGSLAKSWRDARLGARTFFGQASSMWWLGVRPMRQVQGR